MTEVTWTRLYSSYSYLSNNITSNLTFFALCFFRFFLFLISPFSWEGEGDVDLCCLESSVQGSRAAPSLISLLELGPSQLACSLSQGCTRTAYTPPAGVAAALVGLFKELKHLGDISEWFTENETCKISQLLTAGKRGCTNNESCSLLLGSTVNNILWSKYCN